MIKLILLDRDGVINFDSPDYITSVERFVPIPGSVEAIGQLHQAGFQVGICTNQSAVGRGLISLSGLEAIHLRLAELVAVAGGKLAGIEYCPHLPDGGCNCRKPQPGMLRTLMDQLNVEPAATLFVGDSLKDMEAAAAAGCGRILVRTGNGADTEAVARSVGVTDVYDDLAAFAADLISNQRIFQGAQEQ